MPPLSKIAAAGVTLRPAKRTRPLDPICESGPARLQSHGPVFPAVPVHFRGTPAFSGPVALALAGAGSGCLVALAWAPALPSWLAGSPLSFPLSALFPRFGIAENADRARFREIAAGPSATRCAEFAATGADDIIAAAGNCRPVCLA